MLMLINQLVIPSRPRDKRGRLVLVNQFVFLSIRCRGSPRLLQLVFIHPRSAPVPHDAMKSTDQRKSRFGRTYLPKKWVINLLTVDDHLTNSAAKPGGGNKLGALHCRGRSYPAKVGNEDMKKKTRGGSTALIYAIEGPYKI